MPVTVTYPGIYIQELPSSTHTITPTPTSIAVFVGYTHPYKTQGFNQAVQIFSFADYQRAFGSFYHNAWLDSNVAYAVQQFFLNGGSEAYVFGLQSQNFNAWTAPAPGTPPTGGPQVPMGTPVSGAASGSPGAGGSILFSALEPTDAVHAMSVTLSNITQTTLNGVTSTSYDMADVTIAYGSAVDFSTSETFRGVSLQPGPAGSPNPNFIETRINGISQLVWVSPLSASAGYGAFSAAVPPAAPTLPSAQAPGSLPVSVNPGGTAGAGGTTTPPGPPFQSTDFTDVNKGPFVTDGSLDKVPIFNLMLLPGVTDDGVWAQAIAFCERRRAFLIMDTPPNFSADGMTPMNPAAVGMKAALPPIAGVAPGGAVLTGVPVPMSINAALYFPYVTTLDSLSGNPIRLPPGGYVAGIYAQTDTNRGVWKAPAGLATTLTNATGVVPEGVLTDNRAGVLNPIGVDAIRTFAGSGTVVFGARTTTTANLAQQQWRYVPVRRTALFIEQTLYANLGWAVFEPNDTPLWTALRTTVEAFMLTLFNQGAFQGSTPSQAFQVVCDSTTTTQTDIDNGIVNILVAFAPLVPAEFVVIQIAQLAGQAQSS